MMHRIKEKPLSGTELLNYLSRLPESETPVKMKTYRRMMAHPQFKEILEELQRQKLSKYECKKIAKNCQELEMATS